MWEYFIYTYGSQVLLSILCMLFGGLGLLVRQLAQRYLTDESKRAAAATAVRFAEQVSGLFSTDLSELAVPLTPCS